MFNENKTKKSLGYVKDLEINDPIKHSLLKNAMRLASSTEGYEQLKEDPALHSIYLEYKRAYFKTEKYKLWRKRYEWKKRRIAHSKKRQQREDDNAVEYLYSLSSEKRNKIIEQVKEIAEMDHQGDDKEFIEHLLTVINKRVVQ